jgi:hypothetical protein
LLKYSQEKENIMTVITNYGRIELSSKVLSRLDQAALSENRVRGRLEFADGVLKDTGKQVFGKQYLAVYDELVQKKPSISSISMDQVNEAIRLYNGTVTPPQQMVSTGAKVLGVLALAETALSLVRCIWGLPDIGWEDMVESTGVILGVLFVTLDSQGFYGAHVEHAAAQTTDHNEKYCKAAAKLAVAILSFISSVLYLIGKMAEKGWVAISSEATHALLTVSSAFAAVALVIAGVLAALGIRRCHVFAKRLKEYNDPQEQLSYLLNAVTLSDAEKEAVGNNTAERAKEKVEYVRARTSMKAVRMILGEAPELLERFKRNDPTAAEAASKLVQKVIDEGTKKQLVYTVGLIIAVLLFASTVLSMLATGGSLPLILLGVALSTKAILKFSNWYVGTANAKIDPYIS